MPSWFSNKRLVIGIFCVLAAIICACGNGGGIDPSHFYDNFEDNDLTSPAPGWVKVNEEYYDFLGTDANPSDGNLELRLLGGGFFGLGDPNNYQGLYHILGGRGQGITPNYVAFQVSPCLPPEPWGQVWRFANFKLIGSINEPDPVAGIEGIHVFIEYDESTALYTLVVNGVEIMESDRCLRYWVEIKHIDWTQDPPVFDFYLDGQLEAACLPFLNSLDAFTQLNIYNAFFVHARWDEILMRAYQEQEGLTACPRSVPSPEPTPTPTKQPKRPRVTRDTFCWFGPGEDRFEVVNSLAEGLEVDLIGIGDVPGWYVIDSPVFPGAPCWVKETDLDEIAPEIIPLLEEIKTPGIIQGTEPPPSEDDDGGCAPGAPCP
jgi:hypothetical protein